MSHPLAMSVMRNGTFCTTIMVRKKRGGKSGHAQAITSGHVTSSSVHVTSGDVTSGSTSSNVALAVPLYYYRVCYESYHID